MIALLTPRHILETISSSCAELTFWYTGPVSDRPDVRDSVNMFWNIRWQILLFLLDGLFLNRIHPID